MSRCFPFPPPGYEKKTIIDDGDLITKEKRKEKKHKKDKKDKERKEGKEKKDKEKSKEKHREKKERKEKHKDKEKKDKNRSKDKNDKDRNKDKKEGLVEKRIEGPHDLHNGGRLAKNSQHGDEVKDSMFVLELARRIGDENGATGSHMVQKTSATNHEREKIPRKEVESYIDHFSAQNDKHGKKVTGTKINGQEVHSNVHGSSVNNYFSPGDHWRLEVAATTIGKKNVENGILGKWKNELKEDDNQSNKPMGRDRDKSDKEKRKERDKQKEKKEKVKQSYESSIVQSGQNDSSGNHLGTCTEKPFDLSKDGDDNESSAGDGILGKRKEMGRNVYIHDKSTRPCKLARHVSSTRLSSENGKKLEPSQNSLQLLAEKPLPYSNGKVAIKEKKTNGFIEPQQPNSGPFPTNVQVNENGKASEKKPHPDLKYLNKILAVPRMEDLPEIDHGDQEWLFKDNNTQAERSKTYTSGDGSKQVWAEIVHFDDADLIALPYVIPY